jgi:uncharacterized protein (TIGR02145 family)
MTQNLDYGTSISISPAHQQSDNCLAEKYCSTGDPTCSANGALYQWDELMDYQALTGSKGICPPGWHIPTGQEWQHLIDNVVNGITAPIANATAAAELKDQNLPGGFKALLNGFFYQNSHWAFSGGGLTSTMFWTSTPDGDRSAMSRGMNNYTSSLSSYSASKSNAFPVRCIKDQ